MKRSPIQRKTRLRPVSPKKRRKETARREVVRQVHERDEHCRAFAMWLAAPAVDLSTRVTLPPGIPPTCSGPLDVHEIIPRSAWPGGELVPSNCILICRRHHQWVDDHPDEAERVGLHARSWNRPAA